MSDKKILLEAYLLHRASLLAQAASIVGSRIAAEDVVQDAYLVIRDRTPRAPVRRPDHYLRRLVRNLALDRVRSMRTERRHGGAERVPEDAPADRPSPEDEALGRDMVRRLEAALSELPERTRMVFEMNRVGGLSVEEIAPRLGISASLVYQLLRDAMGHCRDRLSDILDGPG